MKKQILYRRTSTTDQTGETQRHSLQQAAEARGWKNVEEISDLGISGARGSRPGLDRLRRSVRAGTVEVVMVAALDRLGRSLPDLLHLLDEFTACGVVVVSLREAVDLGTPAGRFMAQMLAALSQFERELIRERVRGGLARVKATGQTRSGLPVGRPRRQVDIQAALRLRSEGRSLRDIAVALRVPRRTLSRALGQASGAKPPIEENDGKAKNHAA